MLHLGDLENDALARTSCPGLTPGNHLFVRAEHDPQLAESKFQRPWTRTRDRRRRPSPPPPEIVVSVAELLEQAIGPLHNLEASLVDEWRVAWRGTDPDGRRRSGKLTRDFQVGPDHKSIELRWNIVLDAPGA
jgi:hypothetical protein